MMRRSLLLRDPQPPRSFPLPGGFRLAVRPDPFGPTGNELEWVVTFDGGVVESGVAFDFDDARQRALASLERTRAYRAAVSSSRRAPGPSRAFSTRALVSGAGARDPARLTTAQRNRLPDWAFALPERRALPLHDRAHVRNAASRLEQMRTIWGSVTREEYARAKRAILARAAELAIGPFNPRSGRGPVNPRRAAADPVKWRRDHLEEEDDLPPRSEQYLFRSPREAELFERRVRASGFPTRHPREEYPALVSARVPRGVAARELEWARTYGAERDHAEPPCPCASRGRGQSRATRRTAAGSDPERQQGSRRARALSDVKGASRGATRMRKGASRGGREE